MWGCEGVWSVGHEVCGGVRCVGVWSMMCVGA